MGGCVSRQAGTKGGNSALQLALLPQELTDVDAETVSREPIATPTAAALHGRAMERLATELAPPACREERERQKWLPRSQRPTLPLRTGANDTGRGGEDAHASCPILDRCGYALTPVVPVAPYTTRDMRQLIVSAFQEHYSGRCDPHEAEEPPTHAGDEAAEKTPTDPKRLGAPTSGGFSSADRRHVSVMPTAANGEGGAVLSEKWEGSSTASFHPVATRAAHESPPPASLHTGEIASAKPLEGAAQQESPVKSKSCKKRGPFMFFRNDSKKRGVGSGSGSGNNNGPVGVEKKEEKEANCDVPGSHSTVKPPPEETPDLSREHFIQSGTQRLEKRLIALKLVEHCVKSDGNCQFRALAQQLLGSEDLHELIRVHVVTYMKSVRDRFDCYFADKEEADSYYSSMLKSGTWGDELTLRAASDSLHINVHVLSSEQQNFYIAYHPGTDSPSPPAFLVDVATMRQQRHYQDNISTSHLTQAATLVKEGRGGGGGALVMETEEEGVGWGGANPTLRPPTLFTTRESMAPRQNTKNPENGDKKEEVVVDACALQRCLQRKLAQSTIRTAASPTLDSFAPGGQVAGANRGVLLAALDAPAAAMAGDAASKNGTGGCLDVSFGPPSGAESPVGGSVQEAHWRSVSQEVAKFCAAGVKRVEGVGEQYVTLLLAHSTPIEAPPGTWQHVASAPSPHVSVTAAAANDFARTNSAFVLFSPPQGDAGGITPVVARDVPSPAAHALASSLDAGAASVHNGLPTQGDDPSVFVFEGRSEPIDVFLSYLSPVHYNALSLAGERTSSGAVSVLPRQEKTGSHAESLSFSDVEASVPFLRRVSSDKTV